MTEAQAVEAILEAWTTGWAISHPSDCPVVFDNEELDAPTQWARLTIVPTVRVQASMGPRGSRRFISRGRIAVQLFTNVNIGDAASATLAGDVRAVLEAIEIDIAGQPLVVRAGSSGKPAKSTDGNWYMRVVTFPFEWHEVR